MGQLVDGTWRTDEVLAAASDGRWNRQRSTLRHWITRDGSPGPNGEDARPAAAGRYYLYAAWNCPWAHRTLLVRAFKRLEDVIGVSFVAPRRTDQGWVFSPEDGYVDDLFESSALHELYTRSTPDYSGRVTVPILWDRERGNIVSNESADIVRMLGSAFDEVGANDLDLYPEPQRGEIDRWNARIHRDLNNGVYRAGFASTQEAYEEAVTAVFETLDAIEEHLKTAPFLAGDAATEADLRLLPTLFRFDVAYATAFKCSKKRIADYPQLWAYARRFYTRPEVAATVDFDIYRRGYHSPSPKRNPHGIVPIGPQPAWDVLETNERAWSPSR
ncbi:MAG: glutathione S-transferase C-terminal domain-containing protein [Pseudomonadota bacterium]